MTRAPHRMWLLPDCRYMVSSHRMFIHSFPKTKTRFTKTIIFTQLPIYEHDTRGTRQIANRPAFEQFSPDARGSALQQRWSMRGTLIIKSGLGDPLVTRTTTISNAFQHFRKMDVHRMTIKLLACKLDRPFEHFQDFLSSRATTIVSLH